MKDFLRKNFTDKALYILSKTLFIGMKKSIMMIRWLNTVCCYIKRKFDCNFACKNIGGMMSKIIYPVIGNEKRLPFYLTGIGINEPEYDINREKGLVSHQFLMTKSGRGMLEIDGKTYEQRAGSIFYLSPGVPHHYYPDGKEWTSCWMVFRGIGLNEIMTALDFGKWCYKDNIDLENMMMLFNRIINTAGQPVYHGEVCSSLIYEFILSADKIFKLEIGESAKKGAIVERAIMYINKNYGSDITLEQLSEQSDVSLQHFCRVFKKQMGMRPMEYISRLRVSQAKILLSDTTKNISEIGSAVGYEDLTYFGMVFKKYEGVSPSKYRKIRDSLI